MQVLLKEIKKSFNSTPVICGVSLEVSKGDLVAVIGPSGCGKSTLLRCLNGLEAIDSGIVNIKGVELKSLQQMGLAQFNQQAAKIRQCVGMVFQSFNLFPHLTVLENLIKAPMVVRGESFDLSCARAKQLLAKVGLEAHADQYPQKISGGQQQRAAIARALMMTPELMLYDEPTSALDPMLVNEVLRVMKQLDQEGMTQIVVTHEMRFARDVADKIVFMESGQIIEMGPPDQIFSNPKSERTRNFLRHFL